MKCPACDHELQPFTVEKLTVDVCRNGCGGIWFDWFELQKVDEPSEHIGEALLKIEKSPEIAVNYTKKRSCPKCKNVIMMRHFFSTQMAVAVDECPKCGGFWLDAGELKQIREQFASEEDREKAAEAFIEKKFGAQLDKRKKALQQKSEKIDKAARAFKFLYPSAWIPGKQEWGTF
ncbi:zf-TFIIB domain-containing protein [bacterium]|nr:zf-TFIIB domain-containing protein [bacterium]